MHKIRSFQLLQIAALFSLALILCSCASSDRMMRLSPFRQARHYSSLKSGGTKISQRSIKQINRPKDGNNFAERFKNRINIWPFMYREGDFTSIMWPFADFDPHGIAIRPFYNQEGNEYSVLFPFSAWNPVKNDGWAALYYWNARRGYYGLAPFLHMKYEKDRLRRYLLLGGLLNHYSSSSKKNYSFSLLNYYQDQEGGDFSSMFIPFSFYKSNSDYWRLFMLPSFYAKYSKSKSLNTFFPLYYYSPHPAYNEKTFWLMCYLLGHYQQKNYAYSMSVLNFYKDQYNHAFVPLYWYKNKDKKHLNLLGLSGIEYKNEKLNKLYAIPLMFYRRNKLLYLFPYFSKQSENSIAKGIIPLYVYEKYTDGDYTLTLPALLSQFRSTGDQKAGEIFLGLSKYRYDATSIRTYFEPLYDYTTSTTKDYGDKGSLLLSYLNCTYDNSYFKDQHKNGLPRNHNFSLTNLFYGYQTEYTPLQAIHEHGSETIDQWLSNTRVSNSYNIFPYYLTHKFEDQWDLDKININDVKTLNESINKYFQAIKFNDNQAEFKKMANSNNNKLKNRLAFLCVENIETKQPLMPQFIKLTKKIKKQRKESFSTIKSTLQKYGIPITDDSKSGVSFALYKLREAVCKDYIISKSTIFPMAYWRTEPQAWQWWFTLLYAGNNNKDRFNYWHSKPEKKFYHGFIPLYCYSSNKTSSSLVLPALLSWYNSETTSPDCGFSDNVFSDAMKKAGIKQGIKTSANWMLLCHTASEKADAILPVPAKSSNKVSTQSSKQIFWLYNNWSEKYKMWDYRKAKQKDLHQIMSAVATLVDLNYWSLKQNLNSYPQKFNSNSYSSKYKIKKPADRTKWILKTQIKLIKGLNKFGFKGIDLKNRTQLFNILLELDKRYTMKAKSGTTIIPLLYYRNYDRNKNYWNILLLLSDYKREKDYSKFSILKYLLRIEQDKERYNCDVFPFINYSSQQDNCSFSFMWRLFRIEKKKAKIKKLYLGFIPFDL